jgi:hypothetical protein
MPSTTRPLRPGANSRFAQYFFGPPRSRRRFVIGRPISPIFDVRAEREFARYSESCILGSSDEPALASLLLSSSRMWIFQP